MDRVPRDRSRVIFFFHHRGLDTWVSSLSMEDNLQQTQQRPNYEPRFMLSGHTMSVSSLKFSPDGAMLASAGELRFLSVIMRASVVVVLLL